MVLFLISTLNDSDAHLDACYSDAHLDACYSDAHLDACCCFSTPSLRDLSTW
jgi:hypothetical protein